MLQFNIDARDGEARTGRLDLPRGSIDTPAFLPVGTQATVKALTPRDLDELGAQMVLANTYHLMLRPGSELVRSFGGVSGFMGWHKPVLTDSGGYQVFSLADRRKITADGATFRSHIDGSEHVLTPERAVELQMDLNSDILMALDICPPTNASHSEIAESLIITHDWARRCFHTLNEARARAIDDGTETPPSKTGALPVPRLLTPTEQSLFPIVQGGTYADLRRQSVDALLDLDAPGYAIGGVSVGEGPEAMREVVTLAAPLLPDDRPRYLMGVGEPRDLLMGVAAGIDLFDCVLPTRNGRNGQAFTKDGPIRLKNACHRDSHLPLDPECDCYACRHFTRGYLRHLFLSREMLASQVTSGHNVRFLLSLMREAREAVRTGRLAAFANEFMERYQAGGA